MGIFSFFKKNRNESLKEMAGKMIVLGFRKHSIGTHFAPSDRMSDKLVLKIYEEVSENFRGIAQERNEIIPATSINTIVFKFFQVYELNGKKFYYEHLRYELTKYLNEGLREDYKRGMSLV